MFTSFNFILSTLRYIKKHKQNVLKIAVRCYKYIYYAQLCTVDMEIRDLEKTTISLVPELVFMESDTVLVQYIISSWSLQHRNASE